MIYMYTALELVNKVLEILGIYTMSENYVLNINTALELINEGLVNQVRVCHDAARTRNS